MPLKEIVKKAKENPNTIRVGIGGSIYGVQDIARFLFEDAAGIKLVRVPFPGAAENVAALLGGHVDVEVAPAGEFVPLYKAGKFTVLALSDAQRNPLFPEIPTFRELGYDVVISSTHWIAGPKGLPDAITNHLAEAFRKGFSEPGFKETCEQMGANPAWDGPEGSLKAMLAVDDAYQKLIKKFNLQPK